MVEHVLAKDETGVRFSLTAPLILNFKIPQEVLDALETLKKNNFESYLVGGCVRDLLLSRTPKDWDITTNALPEEIEKIFPKTVYENTFGTVAVVNEHTEDPILKVIEITPYRLEGKYTDKRHPDEVIFSKKIEDDLKRRDFTVNAMALNPFSGDIVDLFGGREDLAKKIIRTVGDPDERFREDALRLLRAVRFSTELDFAISHETAESIFKNAELIKHISSERIRDEFVKMMQSENPMAGISMLSRFGLLKHIIPELEEGIGCEQLGEHVYDVFDHLLHALGQASAKNWPLHIRLAALFHDIGKPRTRRFDATKAGGKGKYTFYGHEVVGARMAAKILERLKFPKDISERVVSLVRYHMFFSDTETITLSAVRRTIVNVGRENIWDLMQIRECDRVGMKKKEAPYRLRKYHAMIEEALRAPTSVGMLKLDGAGLKALGIAPGPRMGWILHALLDECLEDDTKNNLENLKSRALELDKLSDADLKTLGEADMQTKEEKEEEEVAKLNEKHGVRK